MRDALKFKVELWMDEETGFWCAKPDNAATVFKSRKAHKALAYALAGMAQNMMEAERYEPV